MSSIREIASRTGFSIATVSRVFNQPEAVSARTREVIEHAAQRLGYHPHPAARALATRRTRIVGAVIPGIEHSIFARFMAALERELGQSGYALVLATTGNDAQVELERCSDLIRMGAEGIVVSGLDHHAGLLAMCAQRRIPLLCTSIFAPESAHPPTIGYDNFSLAATAAGYLKGLGHDRIGVVHGPRHNNDRTRLRIEGIRSVLPDVLLVECGMSVEGGSGALARLDRDGALPTAVLCLSDVLAQGVYFEALRRGFRIPGTLSIMGFDDLDWARWMSPPLTTMHLPVDEMGHETAAALVRHLEDGAPLVSRKLEGQVVERDSTARVGGTPEDLPGA